LVTKKNTILLSKIAPKTLANKRAFFYDVFMQRGFWPFFFLTLLLWSCSPSYQSQLHSSILASERMEFLSKEPIRWALTITSYPDWEGVYYQSLQIFHYNDSSQPEAVDIYLFSGELPQELGKRDARIQFIWDGPRLIKEENPFYTTEYIWEEGNLLYSETKAEKSLSQTLFFFNAQGEMEERWTKVQVQEVLALEVVDKLQWIEENLLLIHSEDQISGSISQIQWDFHFEEGEIWKTQTDFQDRTTRTLYTTSPWNEEGVLQGAHRDLSF